MSTKENLLDKRIELAKEFAELTYKEMRRTMFDDEGEFSIYHVLGIHDGIYHFTKMLEEDYGNTINVDDRLYGFLDILHEKYNYDNAYLDILEESDDIKQLIMGHALCYIDFLSFLSRRHY